MNFKTLFSSFFFASVILFSSCGNEPVSNETPKTDSLKSKLPEALVKLNADIAANPDNPDFYHNRAKYYLDEQKYDKGFEDMKKVMILDSTKAPYFITLSDLYFLTNQTGNSKAALENARELRSK